MNDGNLNKGLHEYKGHPVFISPSQSTEKLLCTGVLSREQVMA